jgi:hypothetical protein
MLLPIKENQTKVRDAINELLFCSAVFFLLVSLSGCGGTKVLKEPEPLAVTQSLATASDQHLSATYLIRVQNLGDDSIRVTNITVTDSLGNRIETRDNRKQLVKGTKEAKRRYKGEGLKVKAGAGVGTLLTAGAVAGAATAAIAGAGVIGLSGGAAAAATGGLILVPVFAVGGVFRGVNNSKVNKQIESRQTLMPVGLQEEEEESFDMFFPLTPSPRQLELTYVDAQGEHVLVVDTKAALEGLHLVQAEE